MKKNNDTRTADAPGKGGGGTRAVRGPDRTKRKEPVRFSPRDQRGPRAGKAFLRESKAERSKGGRPCQLTPELIETITLAIQAGNYIEVAAAYVGIDRGTLRDWLKRGRHDRQLVQIPNAPITLFAQLSISVEKAWAEAEARDVINIALASREAWQASAWRLERKHPDRWGRRERMESGGGGATELPPLDRDQALTEAVAELRKTGKVPADTEDEADAAGRLPEETGSGGAARLLEER